MLWGGHNGGIEIRNLADGETVLRGHFPYGSATVLSDGGGSGQIRKEVIASRAFAARITNGDDIHFLAGHDYEKPLASRAAGSLQIEDTESRLSFEARISPEMKSVTYVRDFMAAMQANLIRGISPGFRVPTNANAENIRADGNAILRTVNKADLFELSAVTKPAYPDAQIEARSWLHNSQLNGGINHVINRWRA